MHVGRCLLLVVGWLGFAAAATAQTQSADALQAEQKWERTAEKWEQALKQAETVEQLAPLAEEALLALEEALAAQQFVVAERLAQVAVAAANQARHVRLRTEALACKQVVIAARRDYDAMLQAGTALSRDPRDPAANLIVGKYLCFAQHDWTLGFSKLMLCGDTELKSLAARSFNAKREATDVRTLGDAWWDASTKRTNGVERLQFQSAAVYFYSQATGAASDRVAKLTQKRIESAAKEADKLRRLPSLIEMPLRADGTVSMRLRLIPAGSFLMGSPLDEPRRGPTEGHRPVVIDKPFYMGTTEVTQKQWYALVPGANVCAFFDDPQLPVENITWNRTEAFFTRLNELAAPRGYRFRLPTSAEWEYACRAGTRTAYFFGNEPIGLSNYAWTADVAAARTHPVGQKRPNPWGLYDMLGNVSEMTADASTSERIARADAAQYRVIRGGDHVDNLYECRSAAVRNLLISARNPETGFRVVCDVVPLEMQLK